MASSTGLAGGGVFIQFAPHSSIERPPIGPLLFLVGLHHHHHPIRWPGPMHALSYRAMVACTCTALHCTTALLYVLGCDTCGGVDATLGDTRLPSSTTLSTGQATRTTIAVGVLQLRGRWPVLPTCTVGSHSFEIVSQARSASSAAGLTLLVESGSMMYLHAAYDPPRKIYRPFTK